MKKAIAILIPITVIIMTIMVGGAEAQSPVTVEVDKTALSTDEVVSLTSIDLTGDIRYHSTSQASPDNQEFIAQIHQTAIQLLMKRWRENLILTREIISSLVKTINKVQIYSSIIGSISFLSGIVTDTPSYLMLSIIPFLATGILALIKRII